MLGALKSATIAAAAQKAGVSERSGYRWLHHSPEFREAYRTAKRACVDQVVVLLSAAAHGAASTLLKIATDQAAPYSSRVSAASKILDLTLKSAEMDDLAGRLEAIEERLAALAAAEPAKNGRSYERA